MTSAYERHRLHPELQILHRIPAGYSRYEFAIFEFQEPPAHRLAGHPQIVRDRRLICELHDNDVVTRRPEIDYTACDENQDVTQIQLVLPGHLLETRDDPFAPNDGCSYTEAGYVARSRSGLLMRRNGLYGTAERSSYLFF